MTKIMTDGYYGSRGRSWVTSGWAREYWRVDGFGPQFIADMWLKDSLKGPRSADVRRIGSCYRNKIEYVKSFAVEGGGV